MRRQGPPGIDPVLLLLRGGLLSVVTLFLGVAGHVTGGGLLPGVATLVVVGVVTTALSLALLARPATTTRLVALLVVGQTLVHLVLSLAGGHHGDTVAAAGPVATGRPTLALPISDGRRSGSFRDAYAGQALTSHETTTALPDDGMLDQLVAHAPMMLAHLLAAALVGLWLAVGERALWTLVALACRAVANRLAHLVDLLRPRPVTLAARVRRTPRPPAPLLHQVLVRALARRGPPARLA